MMANLYYQLMRLRQGDLQFYTSVGYRGKPCLKKETEKRRKATKKIHAC